MSKMQLPAVAVFIAVVSLPVLSAKTVRKRISVPDASFDDRLIADEAAGEPACDTTDINTDCTADFEDFALMNVKWLDDYSLKEAAPE